MLQNACCMAWHDVQVSVHVVLTPCSPCLCSYSFVRSLALAVGPRLRTLLQSSVDHQTKRASLLGRQETRKVHIHILPALGT